MPADASHHPTSDALIVELRRLARIVEDSEDAIISKDLNSRVTSWNPAAARMFGYSADEIIGQPITVLFPERLAAEEAMILDKVKSGQRIEHYETVRVRKDGREIEVALTISPIRGPDQSVVGASKILRDVTHENRLQHELETVQRELLHLSRLNDMGQIASAFAHELNQPLTAMRSYLGALRLALEGGDSATAVEACSRAISQVDRTGAVVSRLRAFVEKREGNRAPERLEPVIEEAASLALFSAQGQGFALSIQLADDARDAVIDRVQVQQVLVNLLRNAVEAMADSPVRRLTVTTRRTGDRRIEVEVADTGPGLPQQVLDRLFEPFTTTKSNGMGVGLSLCRTIIENHQGIIEAGNSPQAGAFFRFSLPAAD